MNKRSNANTSTESTYDKERGQYVVCKQLLPLLFVFFLCMSLGLVAGLVSFFILSREDVVQAQKELDASTSVTRLTIQQSVTDCTNLINSINAFYTVKYGKVTYDEFVPYVKRASIISKGLVTIEYDIFVKNESLAQFVAETQSLGGIFATFTPFTFDSATGFTKLPIQARPRHLLKYHIAPFERTASFLLGYDQIYGDPYTPSVYAAEASGNQVGTARFMAPYPLPGTVPVLFRADWNMLVMRSVQNITDPSQSIGMIMGMINIQVLLESMNLVLLTGVDIYVFDVDSKNNATSFLYTSSRSGAVVNTTALNQLKPVDLKMTEVTSNAYVYSTQPLLVADRNWTLLFVPSSVYLNNYDGHVKKVALACSLVLAFVLFVAVVLLFFIRHLQNVKASREKNKEKYNLLQQAQHRMRDTLAKVALEEKTTRTAIECVSDSVLMISNNGRILRHNKIFEDEFKFNASQMEEGVFINSVIPDQNERDWYQSEQIGLEKVARTAEYEKKKVLVSIKDLKTTSGLGDDILGVLLQDENVNSDAEDLNQRFVVVIKTLIV